MHEEAPAAEGCRVHPDLPVSAYDLCGKCYARVRDAVKRYANDHEFTRVQLETLTKMGRPTARMQDNWPDICAMVGAAKRQAGVERKPEQLSERPLVMPTLQGLVEQARRTAQLGELALQLRSEKDRRRIATVQAESVCLSLTGDTQKTGMHIVVEHMDAALLAVSEHIEALLVGAEGEE